MTTNPASTSDLEDRFYRDLTSRERALAQVWLDDAYDLLIGRRPTLEADVTAGTVTEATVIRVVCSMVARVFSNPEGKVAENIDDYGYRRSEAVSDGLLYVSPDELADITPRGSHRTSVRLVVYGDA
jgi:hypothetical protein